MKQTEFFDAREGIDFARDLNIQCRKHSKKQTALICKVVSIVLIDNTILKQVTSYDYN